MSTSFDISAFSFAFGRPSGTALVRVHPSDFEVFEIIPDIPEGEGEHRWLQISKQGINTSHVVDLLGKACGISRREIGYSGLKDKRAVTTQWFSLPDRAWNEQNVRSLVENGGYELSLLQSVKALKKLRLGTHRTNRFTITLRECSDVSEILERWVQVRKHGVPNYFGPQRFGHDAGNLDQAVRTVHRGNEEAFSPPQGYLPFRGKILAL